MTEPCGYCPLEDPRLVERFCSQCEQQSEPWNVAERLFGLGMELYKAREFEGAASAFRAAAEDGDAHRIEAAFNCALALLHSTEYGPALEVIESVLEQDELPEALYVKGLALEGLKRWDEAEVWLDRAHEAGYELARRGLSSVKLKRVLGALEAAGLGNDPEKKLAYLNGCLSSASSMEADHLARLLVEAGEAAVRLSDFTQARHFYLRACRTDLTPDTAVQLAEFVLDYGDEAETRIAESLVRQALTLAGDHARAHFCLGRLQRSRGELDLAFQSMLHALREAPSDQYVLFESAELAAEMGNIPYCLTALRKLEARADPDPYWLDRAHSLKRSVGAF